MKTIVRILITALALIVVANLVPGIEVANFYIAIIAALVLGVLNLFVKPILVILTLPITILTLGLFLFVINALMFIFASSFIEGFTVNGFIPALIASVIVSIIGAIGDRLLAD